MNPDILETVTENVFEQLVMEKVLAPYSKLTMKNHRVQVEGNLTSPFIAILKSNHTQTVDNEDMVLFSIRSYCPQMSELELSVSCTIISMYLGLVSYKTGFSEEMKNEFDEEMDKTAKDYSLK